MLAKLYRSAVRQGERCVEKKRLRCLRRGNVAMKIADFAGHDHFFFGLVNELDVDSQMVHSHGKVRFKDPNKPIRFRPLYASQMVNPILRGDSGDCFTGQVPSIEIRSTIHSAPKVRGFLGALSWVLYAHFTGPFMSVLLEPGTNSIYLLPGEWSEKTHKSLANHWLFRLLRHQTSLAGCCLLTLGANERFMQSLGSNAKPRLCLPTDLELDLLALRPLCPMIQFALEADA